MIFLLILAGIRKEKSKAAPTTSTFESQVESSSFFRECELEWHYCYNDHKFKWSKWAVHPSNVTTAQKIRISETLLNNYRKIVGLSLYMLINLKWNFISNSVSINYATKRFQLINHQDFFAYYKDMHKLCKNHALLNGTK